MANNIGYISERSKVKICYFIKWFKIVLRFCLRGCFPSSKCGKRILSNQRNNSSSINARSKPPTQLPALPCTIEHPLWHSFFFHSPSQRCSGKFICSEVVYFLYTISALCYIKLLTLMRTYLSCISYFKMVNCQIEHEIRFCVYHLNW